MSKKIRRIVEILFGLLLAAGNAAAAFLLLARASEEDAPETYFRLLANKTAKNMVAVEENTITLPDGSVCTAKQDGERKEMTLRKNGRQIHCISDGPLWHCAGVQKGKTFEYFNDGKSEIKMVCNGVSAADFNYDHLMDIKTDGDTKYIFANDQWLKCDSWELGSTKTARVPNGKTYRWTGSAWQEQTP